MMDYCRFRDINDFFASGQPEKARHLLMEIQSRCIALRDEVSMLRLRLQTAEDALYLAQNLFLEKGFYWLKSPGVSQGPFCPRCYEQEGALFRLERLVEQLICPYCHESFVIDIKRPRTEASLGRPARILRFAR